MTKRLGTILRRVATAGFFALTCAPAAYAQGTWTSLAPLPLPVEGAQGSGAGNINVDLYGYTGVDTNLTRRYNISQNTWTFGTPGPLPLRAEIGYGDNQHGGFVYVIGGRSTLLLGVLNNNDRYDPATDSWQTLAPMNTARAAAATAVLDNSIYVIGGRKNTGGPCSGNEVSVVERYDIDTNSWSPVASYPFPVSDTAARAHDGKIYVFGGCTSSGVTSAVNVYDPRTDTWSPLAPMPTARGSLVAGIVGQVIYAIGGYAGIELSTNEAYNIAKDSWSTAPPMPTPRAEAAVRSHGGRIYVYGGGAFGVSTTANEVFKPNP